MLYLCVTRMHAPVKLRIQHKYVLKDDNTRTTTRWKYLCNGSLRDENTCTQGYSGVGGRIPLLLHLHSVLK